MRIISSILFPISVVFIQGFIREISSIDFDTVGITIGAIGLGQIFPFIIYDTLIVGKIITIKPSYSMTKSQFVTRHSFLLKRNGDSIDKLKKLTYVIFIMNLLLFMVTVYLGITGEYWAHIIFGTIGCLISGIYLLFA